MENIFEELGIPRKYLKATNREDRFIALVHKSWLKYVKYCIHNFLSSKGVLFTFQITVKTFEVN